MLHFSGIRICLVAFFHLIIVSALAQTSKRLTVGQLVPDLPLNNIINYKSSSAGLSDFKGKFILLDFWAPWCAPCLEQIPKLDSLQRKFNGQLVIIPITRESKDFTSRTLRSLSKSKGLDSIMSIVKDTILFKYFPHGTLPHYVWIDSSGRIQAITGSESVTFSNVSKFIQKETMNLTMKNDPSMTSTASKPAFLDADSKLASSLLYQSILTKNVQGMVSYAGRDSTWTWFTCVNHPIKFLYLYSIGKFDMRFMGDNNIILEGFDTKEDSLSVGIVGPANKQIWEEIQYNNLYTYQVVLRDSMSTREELFDMMFQDVNRYFKKKGIQGRMEDREVTVQALVRTSDKDRIITSGGNPIEQHSNYYFRIANKFLYPLLTTLNALVKHPTDLIYVDETNYRQKVDLQISADLSDISAVNEALKKYDLKFVPEKRKMKFVVLTLRKKNPETAFK